MKCILMHSGWRGEPYRTHSSGDIENWWHRPLQSSLSLSLGFALNSWMPPDKDTCQPQRGGNEALGLSGADRWQVGLPKHLG